MWLTREKLAIVADVCTIVGVSTATLLGSSIIRNVTGVEFTFFDLVNGSLFAFLALLSGAGVLYIGYRSFIFLRSKDFMTGLPLAFIFLVFSNLFVGFLPYVKDGWANMFGNEYLLPGRPAASFENVAVSNKTRNAIEGGVVLREEGKKIDVGDYVVLIYKKENDDNYYRRSYSSEAYEIASDYSFNVGLGRNVDVSKLKNMIVVVVRKLDVWFRDRACPTKISALIGQSAILHWVETIFNRHTLLSGVCAHIAGRRRLFPI